MKLVAKTSKRPVDQAERAGATASVDVALKTLGALRDAARECKACDLWKDATQTVFGDGPSKAKIMLVGEQPGDQEDRAGHPFVGPAGKLLSQALEQASIARDEIYLTNVVKHFKWAAAARGKKRIHKKPRYSEIHACRPWLDAELRVVRPHVLVCLGSTAAQSLLSRSFSVTRQRGQLVQSPLAPVVIATVHPSSILRAPDAEARRLQMQAFVNDLRIVAEFARKAKAA
jgi:uracil-DNA glycosylase family protein